MHQLEIAFKINKVSRKNKFKLKFLNHVCRPLFQQLRPVTELYCTKWKKRNPSKFLSSTSLNFLRSWRFGHSNEIVFIAHVKLTSRITFSLHVQRLIASTKSVRGSLAIVILKDSEISLLSLWHNKKNVPESMGKLFDIARKTFALKANNRFNFYSQLFPTV